MISRRRFFGVLAAPFVAGLVAALPKTREPIVIGYCGDFMIVAQAPRSMKLKYYTSAAEMLADGFNTSA